MHYGNGALTRCRDVLDSEFEHCSDLNTSRFLKRMIEAEKPDFIAFTGAVFFSFPVFPGNLKIGLVFLFLVFKCCYLLRYFLVCFYSFIYLWWWMLIFWGASYICTLGNLKINSHALSCLKMKRFKILPVRMLVLSQAY